MLREQKIKNVTWISLVKPGRADLKELKEKFPQIHPLILEDLETPTIRTRVENYDNHLYMVFHFPVFMEEERKTVSQEVDFILMTDAIITVQYDEIPLTENFWHECENAKIVGDQYGKSPAHLLYYILRQFFANSLRELDQIQEKIDTIEEEIFAGHEKEILEDISLLKRSVLDFRRAVKPQHFTLDSLVLQGVHFYGEKTKPFFNDLVGEYLKVWNLLENHKETLDALYETNHSLLSAKTNEVMRTFTILAFITFIPTAIANIYGMNIEGLPLTERPDAFLSIILMMIATTGLVYAALKWKKLV